MIRRLIRSAGKLLSYVPAQTDKARIFPADWLVRQISDLEAEGGEGLRGWNRWDDLKAAIKPGDQLWVYCSPPRTWEVLMGSRGIVLLRNGHEIYRVVTVMN